MSTTFLHSATLSTQNCCKCGVLFAMPLSMDESFKRNQETFYCPSGHAQSYVGKTEEQRLREQLKAQQDLTQYERVKRDEARAEAEHFRKSRDGMKGQLVKTKTRISHGVCPCCNRTVKQMAAHMASKHPEYVANKGEQ